MKSRWTRSSERIADRLWKEGMSGGQILAAIEHLGTGATRASIVSKMERKWGKQGANRKSVPTGHENLDRTGRVPWNKGLKGTKGRVRYKKVQSSVPFNPIPMTDASSGQCHHVVGDVVWRGVSMVCGRERVTYGRGFCQTCIEEIPIYAPRSH